jgi:hypothetical protein
VCGRSPITPSLSSLNIPAAPVTFLALPTPATRSP